MPMRKARALQLQASGDTHMQQAHQQWLLCKAPLPQWQASSPYFMQLIEHEEPPGVQTLAPGTQSGSQLVLWLNKQICPRAGFRAFECPPAAAHYKCL